MLNLFRGIFDFCGTIFLMGIDLLVIVGFASLAILPVSRMMPAKIRETGNGGPSVVMILVYFALLGLGTVICESLWRGFAEMLGDYSWFKVLQYWREARRGFSDG